MKTGIIDVGGGMRAIFAAGVLDACLAKEYSFDRCVGISAGSGNMSSFLAGQKGRNLKYYMDFVFRKQYIGFGNYLKNRSFVNLDYAYSVLAASGGECPLDYPKLKENPAEFTVVACNALTGKAKYFTKEDLSQNNYGILMASSSLPGVNRPYCMDGVPYYDGGIVDPIPVQRLIDEGTDKIVLLLSRPRNYVRTPKRDCKFAHLVPKKYAKTADALRVRYQTYNESLELAKKYEAERRVLILAPEECYGVDTLHGDKEALQRLYADGMRAACAIGEFLRE